jgi:signal peptidase
MENTNTKKTFKQWLKDVNKKKILSIALNTLKWLFVAFSLVITILVFSAQGSKDGVPSIFGKSLITISTDSMEPVYEAGDLVFMEKLSDKEKENLQPGQIITFRAPIDINGDGIVGDINTHRIERVEGNRFITKGDHNLIPDNEGDDPYTVHMSEVIGLCTEDAKLAGVGNVITFLRSSLGFFLCIVLPLILFFLYELYNFVSLIVTERAKRAASGAPAIDEEEIKRRAIEEYIAKQKEEEIKKRAIEEYIAAEAEKKNADSSDES